jgi:hypothetical protein
MKPHTLRRTLFALVLCAQACAFAHPGSIDGIARSSLPQAGNPGVSRYESLVRLRTGLVTHAHQVSPSGAGPDLGPPAEVWYVASVKPEAGTRWRYCVSPRLEMPGERAWAPNLNVTLTGSRSPGGESIELARVSTHRELPAGTSMELASSPEWCVTRAAGDPDTPPRLSLATEHGRRDVVFPDRAAPTAVKGRSKVEPAPALPPTLRSAPKPESAAAPKAAGEVPAVPKSPLTR